MWGKYGENGTLWYCWRECKMIQSLFGKQFSGFSKVKQNSHRIQQFYS